MKSSNTRQPSTARRVMMLTAIGALSSSPSSILAFHSTSSILRSPRQHHRTFSSLPLQMAKVGNLAGKIVCQRFLYKLSPLSDVPDTSYTIEERLRFQVGDDGRELTPIGIKTFLLRDGPPDDDDASPQDSLKPQQRVGNILHKASFHEITESEDGAESYAGNVGGIIDDAGIASALYFAAQPKMVRGNVLELSSGIGFGGIMSCIAAGATTPKSLTDVSPDDDEAATDDDDEILPTKERAPLPADLEMLTLSESNEEVVNECVKNTRISGIPSEKITLGMLDWGMPVKREMKNRYDLILGSDIACQFPDVKGISRQVAYCLKDNFDGYSGGQFVHVGPTTRDTISDLRKKLRNGYNMNVDVGYLELERFDLAPLILDGINEEAAAEEKLLGEEKGYVMYQSQSMEKFSTFVAAHGEGYDGFNGEFYFPAETGMEGEDKPSRWVGGGNVEIDDNYGKPEDPEQGDWIIL